MTQKTKKTIFSGILMSAIGLLIVLSTGYNVPLSASTEKQKPEDTYKNLKIFADVLEQLENNYVDPVNTQDLIRKAIQGMVRSLDPHCIYLPPEAFETLQDDTKGEFSGVGIVITMRKEFLTVVSPIEGTPAHKVGVKAGDIIIKVDGESTKDMTISQAVTKIKGPQGTPVTITVLRKGESEPLDFTITRNIIPIESVRSIVLKPGYGYIRIYNFTEKTTVDLQEALEKLETATPPMKGLVMDLRDNPGGLLPQAIGVSDLFIDEGIILSIKGRVSKHNDVYRASPNKTKRDYPIIALINGGSASASEIVAGALQDHKRALILGTTTFGKGSVQTVKPLRDGSGLKFTIARYYTPNGRSIQAKGIEPDVELKRFVMEPDENTEIVDLPIKEKDLKNHLEAVPAKDKPPRKPSIDKKNEIGSELDDTEYASLKLDKLLEDNQVHQALSILVSYETFKNLYK